MRLSVWLGAWKEIVVLGEDINVYVGIKALGYKGIHRGQGNATQNKESEKMVEFGEAMKMMYVTHH